jgi:hypothetical protein
LGPDSNLLPEPFQKRNDIFGEQSVLVRKPALEVISYLNQLDWLNQKTPKFMLWGKPGMLKI